MAKVSGKSDRSASQGAYEKKEVVSKHPDSGFFSNTTRKMTWFALLVYSVVVLMSVGKSLIVLDAAAIGAIAAGFALIITPAAYKSVKDYQTERNGLNDKENTR